MCDSFLQKLIGYVLTAYGLLNYSVGSKHVKKREVCAIYNDKRFEAILLYVGFWNLNLFFSNFNLASSFLGLGSLTHLVVGTWYGGFSMIDKIGSCHHRLVVNFKSLSTVPSKCYTSEFLWFSLSFNFTFLRVQLYKDEM